MVLNLNRTLLNLFARRKRWKIMTETEFKYSVLLSQKIPYYPLCGLLILSDLTTLLTSAECSCFSFLVLGENARAARPRQ